MRNDLSVTIGSLKLKNPLLTASGTCGYGDELQDYFDISILGAIVSKSLTLKPKIGNEPPRITEVACGMLNSIGLANIGVQQFISEKIPVLRSLDAEIVVNIAAKRVEDYVSLAESVSAIKEVSGLELNLSCPNVKEGGIEFGTDMKTLAEITRLVRDVYPKVLIVKLTPNVTRIGDYAKAAEGAGAEAVTVANTYVGMAVDIFDRTPKIHTVTGGLSGPAIKPLTMAKVFEVYNSVKIPIIASGGVYIWQDVVEYLIAGATAVQLGTVLFRKPNSPVEMLEEIDKYLTRMRVENVKELTGSLNVEMNRVPHR
ncbi:MAG: dihydroorotate dehydrogenase [Bacteroidetes bacterium]|nr:dihydroorotate dehydrogenase [Bacteroidota bacterium]